MTIKSGKVVRPCFTEVLDQQIRALGFSVREAKKIRKAVFSIWARALWRGEIVETPLGDLMIVGTNAKRRRWNHMRGQYETAYKDKYRIQFTPRKELVEVISTRFYNDRDYALLKELGRKPWALTPEQQRDNEAALQKARTIPQPITKTWRQMSPEEKMIALQRLYQSTVVVPGRPNRWTVEHRRT